MQRSRGPGISRLFEGHYRALEGRFAALIGTLSREAGGVTVVAADSGQLERLRGIAVAVLGAPVLGGIRFLPGMTRLAEKICPLPFKAGTVSHADRTLFALAALEETRPGEPLHDLRGNAETAHSMSGFFEDLLEQGITPSAYQVQAMSSTEDSVTVTVAGRVFAAYHELRGACYPMTVSDLVAQPVPPDTEGTFLFYGFYDLNPGQRAVVRKLAACPGASIHWFSPLGALSPWAPLYARTREFLERLGIAETVGCDGDSEMGRFASFFESLPVQERPTPPHPGFGILVTAGPMGTARAVLNRIDVLAAEGGSPSSVAVVTRSREEASMIARLAMHEGVPVAAPLEASIASMPLGRLVTALLDLEANDFHHLYVTRLAMSGCLKQELSPSPAEVIRVVLSSGVRMDRDRWMDWVAADDGRHGRLGRLLSGICLFYGGLPAKALPAEYAATLERLVVSLAEEEPVRPFLDLMLDPSSFRAPGRIGWSDFAAALRIHLDRAPVTLVEGAGDGFSILTPERLRGGLYDSVILTGMEEGVWPSMTCEDPRLPEDFRAMLELPLKRDREIEDGFLLRQAGEAAGRTLDLVLGQRKADGSEVYPSPLIARLIAPREGSAPGAWLRRESSSPLDVLLGGRSDGQAAARLAAGGRVDGSRPFLACVVRAEEERFGGGPFGPWDGILEGFLPESGRFSATLLESYVRCPFGVLAGTVWRLRERQRGAVSAEPDPLLQGRVIHRAVESVLLEQGFGASRERIRGALREASRDLHVAEALGSADLETLFLGGREESVAGFFAALAGKGWSPLGAELELNGSLGSLDITGRLDLLLEDGEGGLVVLDLKSGRLPGRKDTVRGRSFQLPFYHALVSGREPGREVTGVYYASLSEREPGRLEGFSGPEMEELLPSVTHRAEALAALILEGLFPPLPTDSDDCRRCAFGYLCRRSPEERLVRKASGDPRLGALRKGE